MDVIPTVELSADELARLVSRVAAMGTASSASEGIDRLRQFEVLKNAICAAQMREAVALDDERRAADAARGVPADQRGRGVAGELGLARRISPSKASRWLGLARVLPRELPLTFAQLEQGAISEWRAVLVARETIFLSREQRSMVDAELAPQLAAWGDRRVEGAARRLAQRLDPAGAAERARRAARERRVTVRPVPDTMCRVSLLLPVAQAVGAYAALRRHADTLIGIGAQGTNPDGSLRTRDQIMADTAFERLTGRSVADGADVELNLVMSDDTLVHRGDQPGVLLGYGPLPAPLARDLALHTPRATGGTGGAAVERWIRRLYLAPDGTQLAAMDTRRREFTDNQRLFLRLRDQDTCRTPWCDAPLRHLDHVTDHARGGPTSTANGQGLCAACNYTKQAAGWTATTDRDGTITTRTPTGHKYESRAPAPPGTPPRPATGTSPLVAATRDLLADYLWNKAA